jgi:TonB family protein
LFAGFSAIFLGLVIVTAMAISRFPLLAAPPFERGATARVQDDDNPGNVVRRRALVPGPDVPEGGEVVVVLTFNSDGEIVDSNVVSGPDRLRQTALQSALLNNNYNVQTARDLQVVVEFPAASQTPSPPDTLRVSAGVAQGNLLQRVQPVYPEAARTNGVEGTVILEATIGTDGRVTDIRVLAGDSLLAFAAVEAVRQWVYEPVLLNGQTVGIVTTVAVNFSLP